MRNQLSSKSEIKATTQRETSPQGVNPITDLKQGFASSSGTEPKACSWNLTRNQAPCSRTGTSANLQEELKTRNLQS